MTPRRTTTLKRLVTRPEIAFLMEAHSGLSARIVEEAGFEGVWGSGLTISAAFGVRDNNELSWSQGVDHVAFMAEATSIPLLLDGDTGYGNFNNMRRLVRKLEQVGVAGVTIEDKLFPKTNSFLRSELQPLADVIAPAPTRSSSTAASRVPPRSSRSSTSGATARRWCWCRQSTGARPPRSSARAA